MEPDNPRRYSPEENARNYSEQYPQTEPKPLPLTWFGNSIPKPTQRGRERINSLNIRTQRSRKAKREEKK